MIAEANRRTRPLMLSLVAVACLLCVPPLLAQKGVPTFTGKGTVTEALDSEKGALFDIGKGVTMYFPVGLPVGSSRLVTLKQGKRPPANAVTKGFKPLGPTLDFNGALSAKGNPIVLTVKSKRVAKKPGQRIVLAMEIGTFCEAHNKKYKLSSGLCSGWNLVDASYDTGGEQLVARLEATGGMRMQFGLAPEESE